MTALCSYRHREIKVDDFWPRDSSRLPEITTFLENALLLRSNFHLALSESEPLQTVCSLNVHFILLLIWRATDRFQPAVPCNLVIHPLWSWPIPSSPRPSFDGKGSGIFHVDEGERNLY